VISGVALREQAGEPETHAALTSVTFRELDDDLIDWYVATANGASALAVRDPAGGGALIREIDGDYNNVVGLPLALLLDLRPDLLTLRST